MLFCSLFFYSFHNSQIIYFTENDGEDEKFWCLVLLQRRWEAQAYPQSPSQRPQVHPMWGMAATCWTLARSYPPQLLHTAVILSSEDNLSNYSSENGTMWVIFTSHFSFHRLSLFAVGYLLPLMPALRSSFLGLYFTFNECFCNFMTVFWR